MPIIVAGRLTIYFYKYKRNLKSSWVYICIYSYIYTLYTYDSVRRRGRPEFRWALKVRTWCIENDQSRRRLDLDWLLRWVRRANMRENVPKNWFVRFRLIPTDEKRYTLWGSLTHYIYYTIVRQVPWFLLQLLPHAWQLVIVFHVCGICRHTV